MNRYQKKVFLCFVDGIHYDCVYPRSVIQHTAICQSVIYEVLYQGVFGLTSELEEAVMFIRQQKKGTRENSFSENLENGFVYPDAPTERPAYRSTPPLPYRIAKALDPAFFRNVELDIIQEEKREAKLRNQQKGFSAGFAPGDKCQLCLSTQPSKVYNGHIQELTDNQGPVIVFIEELGEKRAVPYDSLRPLPLAPINGCTPSVGNKSKRKKGIPLSTDYSHQQYHITGRGLNWNIRRNFDMGRKVIPTEQPMVKTGEQMEHDNHYCQLPSPMPMSTAPSPLVASPPMTQAPGYWMLTVNVPFLNTIGQVNLNWMPSQDPQGKDLPVADMNTLRYFFNLGVEYHRVSSSLQQAQQPVVSQLGPPLPPPPPPPMMMTDMMTPTLTLQPQMDQGQCHHQSNTNCNKYRPKQLRQGSSKSYQSTSTVNGEGSSALLEMDRDMDSYSLSQESGCLSDCSDSLSPTKSEGLSEDGDSVDPVTTGGKQDNRSLTNSDLSVEGVQEQSKSTKGKKKYYMYGSHKLVKPIKEIPPRFQSLLAEMSAAKLRCEGQLIYIQSGFDQDASSHLNVDANCFVPGPEPVNGFPSDGCGGGGSTISSGQVSFIPCIMPPPNSGAVNPPALPQMTYVGLPTAPPPLPPAINKPPPTPVTNVPCSCCATCQQPVNATPASARPPPVNTPASAANVHHSGCSKDSNFPVPNTVTSSQPVPTGTLQNPVASLTFVPPTSMAFIPPPPMPANSGLTSNASTNTATFSPNMPAPAPTVLSPPPSFSSSSSSSSCAASYSCCQQHLGTEPCCASIIAPFTWWWKLLYISHFFFIHRLYCQPQHVCTISSVLCR
ncbi:uncharacterized protein LOC121375536 [Gigantopelta aegis]|uniref:uncharacterized protein LOC121375536 n=1 Tax=Gigantopelta aegis TaxID=1735272 RepID=UPI001B887D6B|nr:uncharacterized protein LOC121375536 [Gigantopelta aegis]